MAKDSTFKLYDADGNPQEMSLRGLDRPAWAALLDKHQPRPSSDDEVWNGATFPTALVAACASLEEHYVAGLWDQLPEVESDELFYECLRISTPGSTAWAERRLRDNSRVMAEVRAAARVGLGRSEFLKTWSDEDQDMLIALTIVEADTCPGGCGVARSEMNDPTAYQVATSRCLWCQQLEIARGEIPADQKHYRHVTLIPKKG